MDRRDFFRRGIENITRTGLNSLEQRANEKARHWIRPPFAKQELDFLLACTRCDACVEACPHQVVFALPLRAGADVVGTPALDVLNKGCQLCSDWPCVAACDDQALAFGQIDETQELVFGAVDCPPMGKAVINVEQCLPYQGPECGACQDSCPIPNTLQWDMTRPTIDNERCVGCGLCREQCIANPKAIAMSVA